MKSSRTLAILSSLTMYSLAALHVNAAQGDNVIEFKTLCGIYRQLKFISSQSEEAAIGLKRPILSASQKNVQEVRRLLAGEEVKTESNGETEAPSTKGKQPIHPQTPFETYATRLARKRVDEILGQITEGGRLFSELKDVTAEIPSLLRNIKTEATQAICGASGGNNLEKCTEGGFGTDLAPGSATEAGKSLASDMAYLCQTATGSNECVDTGAASASNNAANAALMYAHLIAKCPGNQDEVTKVTYTTLSGELHKFFSLLGMRVKDHGSLVKHIGAVLGKFEPGGDNECGSSTSSYVCINYGARTNAKNEEIPWVGKVRTILKDLETIDQARDTVRQVLREVQKLEDEAWGEYDKVEAALNISFTQDSPRTISPVGTDAKNEHEKGQKPTVAATISYARRAAGQFSIVSLLISLSL